MPEPEKLERDPPETETSYAVKSVEGSERVSVRVALLLPNRGQRVSEALLRSWDKTRVWMRVLTTLRG